MHILITDDHAAVRRSLREMLSDALPGAIFSEATNGNETMEELAKHRFSVLLLDINMPDRNGFDVLRDVKNGFPELPVIMLSVQAESAYAARCLRAGAAAYVNKDNAPERLASAILLVTSPDAHHYDHAPAANSD